MVKKITQLLLLVLSVCGVLSLGYYAYVLSSDTLKFAFAGEENQTGQYFSVYFSSPGIGNIFRKNPKLLDPDAIIASLEYNNTPYTIDVNQGNVLFHDDFFRIMLPGMHEWDTLRINAEKYNTLKKTSYRLPKDIRFTYSLAEKQLSVEENGLPKNAEYRVVLSGYDALSAKDIRWYVGNPHTSSCMNDDETLWDHGDYREVIAAKKDTPAAAPSDAEIFSLDVDTLTDRQCLVAGIGGDMILVSDRKLDPFTVSGSVSDVLSPEIDMKSRIEITFSSPIFMDSGTVNGQSDPSWKDDVKKSILDHLTISPSISVTESGISLLDPKKIILTGDFQEGKRYHVSLDAIEDIYGRSVKFSLNFTPEKKPLLSLAPESQNSIFPVGEDIPFKIYSLSPEKEIYSLKVCRVSLADYMAVNALRDTKKKESYESLYAILDSDRTTACTKKDIPLNVQDNVTHLSLHDFYPEGIEPGFYMIAFKNQSDVVSYDSLVAPQTFSVIDSEMVLKADSSGGTHFFLTDIHTLQPLAGRGIRIFSRSGDNSGNSFSGVVSGDFSSSVLLGKTDDRGILALSATDGSQIYGLMNQGSSTLPEFVAVADGQNHLGYLMNTWSDGLSGWNFGIRQDDYSWEVRPKYSLYFQTDKNEYFPGEQISFYGIVRENTPALRIPENLIVKILIRDPQGVEIKNAIIKPNEYGTIVFEYPLSAESSLGHYTVEIENLNHPEDTMTNTLFDFQVVSPEKNSFVPSVTLMSKDIESGFPVNLKKTTNTDPSIAPWYRDEYRADMMFEGIITAKYKNGETVKNMPFTYKLSKRIAYDTKYRFNCFSECFFDTTPEYIAEGKGRIDSDGMGYVRMPEKFQTFTDDYEYQLEVVVHDPITGKDIPTSGVLPVRLPPEYKSFLSFTAVKPVLENRILVPGVGIDATLRAGSNVWNMLLNGKYTYSLIERQYRDDSFSDVVVRSSVIQGEKLQIDTTGLNPGEYHLRIAPLVAEGQTAPDYLLSDTLLFLEGTMNHSVHDVLVVPNKTEYRSGETARILFVAPFPAGKMLITREQGGVSDSKYVTFSGGTYQQSYTIDDTFFPNSHISAIAFPDQSYTGSRLYSIGYGDINADMLEKTLTVSLKTNKELYKTGGIVQGEIALRDRYGFGKPGEFSVLVTNQNSSESYFPRISLSLFDAFYRRYPLVLRTALTAIGRSEQTDHFEGISLGTKALSSFSDIFSSLSGNTEYFYGSIQTDGSGNGKFSFPVPDNDGTYGVTVFAQTKDSSFGGATTVFSSEKNFSLEGSLPDFVYPGDQGDFEVTAKNTTDTITAAKLRFEIGSGQTAFSGTQDALLNIGTPEKSIFHLPIPEDWHGDFPYTLTLMNNDQILDQKKGVLSVLNTPILAEKDRNFGSFKGEKEIFLTHPSVDLSPDSLVEVRVSSVPLVSLAPLMNSLQSLSYRSIEETIAQVFSSLLFVGSPDIFRGSYEADKEELKKQALLGLEKVLGMFVGGGWKYLQSDTLPSEMITPYVARSLQDLHNLGMTIPPEYLHGASAYLENLFHENRAESLKNPDYQAEIFFSLASLVDPLAETVLPEIDPNLLGRHGLVAYTFGKFLLEGKIDETLMNRIDKKMREDHGAYFFWSYSADQALYARLLVQAGKLQEASLVLDTLLGSLNPDSRYISTMERIELLRAVIAFSAKTPISSQGVVFDGGILQAEATVSKDHPVQIWDFPREKLSDKISLKTTNPDVPLYYEIVEKNIPKDILTQVPTKQDGIAVTRTIEAVDESQGVDLSGNFLSVSPLRDNTMELGKLYKVTVTVNVTMPTDQVWRDLLVESFVGSGLNAFTRQYTTESQLNMFGSVADWSLIEKRRDRILLNRTYGVGGGEFTAVYYVRPLYRGLYLLPPVDVSFLHEPSTHAIGAYTRIIVQ